jgi:hypothetical protein
MKVPRSGQYKSNSRPLQHSHEEPVLRWSKSNVLSMLGDVRPAGPHLCTHGKYSRQTGDVAITRDASSPCNVLLQPTA